MPNNTWKDFYELTKNKPPSEILQRAITFVKNREAALDLGAGALQDTKYLLAQGFESITVVDSEPLVGDAVVELASHRVQFVQCDFAEFPFSENKYDLINAQYALPFNNPSSFDDMFNKLMSSLKPNGVFTGQFLVLTMSGLSKKPDMTFHTLSQVQVLLSSLQIIELKEKERDSHLASGSPKHWHLFHVIAVK